MDNIMRRVVALERAPPRCEASTQEKIKEHEYQLYLINNRLKPYKKDPPLVFKTATALFVGEDVDRRRRNLSRGQLSGSPTVRSANTPKNMTATTPKNKEDEEETSPITTLIETQGSDKPP